MKIKRIISTIMLGTLCVTPLVACGSNTSITPGNGEETETPISYPYMDYMEQKVYAAFGTIWTSTHRAVGEDTMDNVVAGTATFNNVLYDQIVFQVKTGTNIKNVSFNVIAEKDCTVELVIGCYSPEDGYTIACYLGGDENITKVNLSAGISQSFSIETTKTFKGEVFDAGRYPVGMDSKCQYIEIRYNVWKGQNTIGSYYYSNDEIKAEGFNIKFNKVSFDVEKM